MWFIVCLLVVAALGMVIGWNLHALKVTPKANPQLEAMDTALRMSLRGWETERHMWAIILDDAKGGGRHVA